MGRSTRRRPRPNAGPSRMTPSMLPRDAACRVRPTPRMFRLTSSKILTFFLLFLLLPLCVSAGTGAESASPGVHTVVQRMATIGAVMLAAGSSNIGAPNTDCFAHATTVWMPLLPTVMQGDELMHSLPETRTAQLRLGYASRLTLPPGKEATKSCTVLSSAGVSSHHVMGKARGVFCVVMVYAWLVVQWWYLLCLYMRG